MISRVRRALMSAAQLALSRISVANFEPSLVDGQGLFDSCDQTVRPAVMRGLGLGHVVKADVLRTVPRAVAAGTRRGETEGVADSAVAAANPAAFRRQKGRSIPSAVSA